MPTDNFHPSERRPETGERQVLPVPFVLSVPTRALPDYFLPAYIEDALKQAGLFQTREVPFEPGGELMLEHLEVTPAVLSLIGAQLRQRQADLLRDERAADRLTGLSLLANELTQPDSLFRQEALQMVGQFNGFSPEMIELLLDSFGAMFGMVQPDMATGEMFIPQGGPGFTPTPWGYARFYSDLPDVVQKYLRPGTPKPENLPKLVTSIAAGNVPGISVLQAFFPIIIGAACLTKNASAEPYFGGRFFSELADFERERSLFPASDLVAMVTFPGSNRALLEEIVRQGDHVIATGGHDSKREILGLVDRLRLRGRRDLLRRVSGHWHKVSFDVVAREYLAPEWIEKVAYNVAFDNSMFNTQGCLSCQQVFVEGSEAEVLAFGQRFMEQMRIILKQMPKGCDADAGLREMYNRCEKTPGVKILTGLKDMAAAPFFAAYEGQPGTFGVFNALNRSIMIRRVANLETDLARLLKGVPDDLLQSCGAAIPAPRLLAMAELLGRAGVNRIAPVGDIWNMVPGIESWDGYLPPLDLIGAQRGYWTTIKFQDPDQAILETYARNHRLLK